jgi:two-component system chemotaxis response regulator CheY
MVIGEVLIVDDSFTSRMIIQRCIEMAGFEVGGFRYAENGLDAIAEIKEHPGIAVIVTDINMPKMDGLTFLRLLKADAVTASIPAIVVSSIVEGNGGAELSSLGALAVIKKPVSPAKIIEAFGGIA